MKYHYQVGASHWSRHSNKPFKNRPQWWFRDVFNGDDA